MSGLPEWIPGAVLAAQQIPTKKGKKPVSPQDMLRLFISIWLNPDPAEVGVQTEEQQQAAAMKFAMQMGGRVVKPGED